MCSLLLHEALDLFEQEIRVQGLKEVAAAAARYGFLHHHLVDRRRAEDDGKLLEALGSRVLTAGSGEEALRILRTKSSIDVVVSEAALPVMDGLELLCTIRLTDGLEKELLEKGISNDAVGLILESIGEDAGVLSNLVKTVRTTSGTLDPKESLKTTGVFFVIGALPVLAPFFIATLWDVRPSVPAIIAFVLAAISISIAGLFMAVLSGKRISTNIMHNLFIIMGTAVMTYVVGLAARLLLMLNQ